MRTFATVIATTTGLIAFGANATEPEPSKTQLPEQIRCVVPSGENQQFKQQKCEELKKLLQEMRAAQIAREATAAAALDACVRAAKLVDRSKYRRGDAASDFFAVLEARTLEELDEKGSASLCNDRVAPRNIPSGKVDPGQVDPDPADLRFRKALKAYQEAATARDSLAATLKTAESSFSNWRKTLSIQDSDAGEQDSPRLPKRLAKLRCNFAKAEGDADILTRPDDCIDKVFRLANPAYGTEDGEQPERPSRWNLGQTLTTAQSGANAAFTFGRTIQFKGTDFESDTAAKGDKSRRTRTISFTGGVEAKLEDGIANIVGGNSDDANFLSLDRLNNDVVFKGSLGFNFFRRESWADFIKRREKFLKEARSKCLADANKGTASLVTDCYDKGLLKWLYRQADGKYAQADLVSKFEQLIAKSSEGVPQAGFGFTASAGLANQDYHLFSDADRNLDASLVDEVFFTDPSDSTQFREINQRLAYTGGIYGYWNWKLKDFPFFSGATLRGDFLTKRELESLEGKKTEICRADLASIAMDGIFDAADQCSSTIIFRPRMQTSYIPKIELRLQTNEGSTLPALGIAPSYQREFRNGRKDKTRWEIPLFLTSKDGNLNGGLGVAFTKDGELRRNRQATTLFIFLGRKFSLDGSK